MFTGLQVAPEERQEPQDTLGLYDYLLNRCELLESRWHNYRKALSDPGLREMFNGALVPGLEEAVILMKQIEREEG